MHDGQRFWRYQPSMRGLLLLAGIVLLLIAGLLGMHTFTANPAGHGTAPISHTAATVAHPDTSATGAIASPSMSGLAADCDGACHLGAQPQHGHTDMVNACVLALLVGMLLLIPPMLLYRLSPLLRGTARSWRFTTTSLLPRPPSLIFLSISRT